MDDNYQYTTTEQQIRKLKNQKLNFEDEKQAKMILETYGYYNIINGYRDPYITRSYNTKTYNPGVTFEQIFSLFTLDHNIRNGVLLAMIDLEEHLRAVVANIIAEDFGIDHNDYLETKNYRDKGVSDSYFSRKNILNALTELAEQSRKEPIAYYRKKYNTVPPWILLKATYFGTLVNYIRLFKGTQKDKLVYALYDSRITPETKDTFKDLLSDTLFLCLNYRNLAAHGGRIYNYTPQKGLRILNRSQDTHTVSGLSHLLYALKGFSYEQPFKCLEDSINDALNSHCRLYPSDVTLLETATGMSISVERYVWINENSHKYHAIQHCSGSKTCKKTILKTAQDAGYSPCKKCCSGVVSTT